MHSEALKAHLVKQFACESGSWARSKDQLACCLVAMAHLSMASVKLWGSSLSGGEGAERLSLPSLLTRSGPGRLSGEHIKPPLSERERCQDDVGRKGTSSLQLVS